MLANSTAQAASAWVVTCAACMRATGYSPSGIRLSGHLFCMHACYRLQPKRHPPGTCRPLVSTENKEKSRLARQRVEKCEARWGLCSRRESSPGSWVAVASRDKSHSRITHTYNRLPCFHQLERGNWWRSRNSTYAIQLKLESVRTKQLPSIDMVEIHRVNARCSREVSLLELPGTCERLPCQERRRQRQSTANAPLCQRI